MTSSNRWQLVFLLLVERQILRPGRAQNDIAQSFEFNNLNPFACFAFPILFVTKSPKMA
jgi:hypothetical protein